MLVVTHHMKFARDVGHRVVFLDQGVIGEAGSPEELLEKPKHPSWRSFWAAGVNLRPEAAYRRPTPQTNVRTTRAYFFTFVKVNCNSRMPMRIPAAARACYRTSSERRMRLSDYLE